ncbi:SAM-dependent methyltransferase [Pseudoruegeria sp. SHC-113]|uniref:SAM-dependent methyltransferase n=1 Tax=Pseudoruegeria sp. SHC-113 TaxID=2855439 RepID=UPI0021BA5690|nr:SAM-dependent methyltransferase [Pseudoruegeria sp. SHC-113]MCT8158545.1 SAM-dependent methyltransferase [Pseudoruegeria sp. SHC-113]
MSRQAPITDQKALARARQRAAQHGDSALFLQEEALLEIKERLSEVNRAFKRVAVITPWPALWQPAFPEADVLEDGADLLAFPNPPYDLVIHAMGLHWAGDIVGQLVQCRLALKPDGLFLGAALGGQTLHELRASLAQAETQVSGGLSPRVLPMAEIRDLGALLQRAGFALPVADSATQVALYRDLFHLAADLRAMGETNALTARRKTFARRALFAEAARIYAEAFGQEGRIRASFELIFLTGWAPHADQPKPLRPGSAAQRLSDALNTDELPLPGANPTPSD